MRTAVLVVVEVRALLHAVAEDVLDLQVLVRRLLREPAAGLGDERPLRRRQHAVLALRVANHPVPVPPVPHKDFSDLYETMSGKGESASEAHRITRASPSMPSGRSQMNGPSR